MFTVTNLNAFKSAFDAITSPTGGGGTLDHKLFTLVSDKPIQKVRLISYTCKGLPVSRIETKTNASKDVYSIASEKMQLTGIAVIKIGTNEFTCKLHAKIALQLANNETECKFQVSTADAVIQWISVSCIAPMSNSELLAKLAILETTNFTLPQPTQ